MRVKLYRVLEFVIKSDFSYLFIQSFIYHSGGTLLGYSLSLSGVRVSHLRITSQNRNVLQMVERFFDAWNMMDLSDEGRLLISLAGGALSDSVLNRVREI